MFCGTETPKNASCATEVFGNMVRKKQKIW